MRARHAHRTPFADYASRETALREHRAEIEAWLGLRDFERGGPFHPAGDADRHTRAERMAAARQVKDAGERASA